MPDSSSFLSAFFILFVSYVCSNALQAPTEDRRYTLVYRRGDVSGLFPFPRVGRSQPSSDDLFGHRSSEHGISKRQGLIPFPRVGKRHSHTLFPTSFFPRTAPVDSTFDDYSGPYAHHHRVLPVVGLTSSDEESSIPWGISSTLESGIGKRSRGQEQAPEGMWFGPRLGRRKRRSADLGGESEEESKHRQVSWSAGSGGQRAHPGSSFWSAADDGASTREFLERHPNLRSILRSKEVHYTTDEEDEVEQEDSELYGDPETSAVDDVEAFGEDSADSMREGRRKRRQPEELETKNSSPKDASNKGEGAGSVNRWTTSGKTDGGVESPRGSSRDQH